MNGKLELRDPMLQEQKKREGEKKIDTLRSQRSLSLSSIHAMHPMSRLLRSRADSRTYLRHSAQDTGALPGRFLCFFSPGVLSLSECLGAICTHWGGRRVRKKEAVDCHLDPSRCRALADSATRLSAPQTQHVDMSRRVNSFVNPRRLL